MAYSEAQDITDGTGTDVDTAIISRLITRVDSKIDALVAAAGLPAISGDTPALIHEASISYSTGLVLKRTLSDGTTPETLDVENTTTKSPILKLINEHNKSGDAAMAKYIAANEDTDVPSDFKAFAVVGRGGSREDGYSVMSSDEGGET